jgi:hypothetical protein
MIRLKLIAIAGDLLCCGVSHAGVVRVVTHGRSQIASSSWSNSVRNRAVWQLNLEPGFAGHYA